MPLQLLIRLGLNSQDPVEITIVSDERAEPQVKNETNLSKSNIYKQFSSAIIVLDARLVRLTTVKLPKATRSQLIRAVPFALEESLAQDLEALHFALGARQNTQTPVAIIDKARFAAIVSELEPAGLSQALIISEVQALPYHIDSWTLLAEDNSILIRTGPYQGFRCAYSELNHFLRLACKQSDPPPTRMLCYLTPDQQLPLPALREAFPHFTWEEHPIANAQTVFISTLQQPECPLLDLRQGVFQPHSILKMGLWWRLAIGLLTLNIAVAAIASTAEYYWLSKKNQHLSQQIQTLYQQVFPGSSPIVAPKIRVEQRLQTLTNQAKGSIWYQLISTSLAKLAKYDAIECTQIDFKTPTLIISVKADDFASLGQYTKELEQAGFSVTQEKSVAADKVISAKLTITGAHT